ncbi:unnamed protein product, partial [Polarella glacialis]
VAGDLAPRVQQGFPLRDAAADSDRDTGKIWKAGSYHAFPVPIVSRSGFWRLHATVAYSSLARLLAPSTGAAANAPCAAPRESSVTSESVQGVSSIWFAK